MTMSLEKQLADYGEHLQRMVDEIELPPAGEIAGRRPAPAPMRRPGWAVAVAAFAVSLLIGAAALLILGLGEGPQPAIEPLPITIAPTPMTVPPTGLIVPDSGVPVVTDELGLRVPVEAPTQTRAQFLAELDAKEWATYTDDVVGWSVRYPADWTVREDSEPGRRLVLETPTPGYGLTITLALDARPGDFSSYHYQVGSIERAVAAGELYPPLDEATVDDYWIPVDHNFNGVFDPQDISNTDLYRAVDEEGNSIPEGHPTAWFWSWAYYDPAAEPAYGYLFEDFGADRFGEAGMYPAIDWIVLSFEPPVGIPREDSP